VTRSVSRVAGFDPGEVGVPLPVTGAGPVTIVELWLVTCPRTSLLEVTTVYAPDTV
jgi:hypothetical protein